MFIDGIIGKIAEYSPARIIFFITGLVLAGSIPIVYFLSILFSQAYSPFMFAMSLILPLMLTPPIIYVILKASKNLKHVQEALQEEIEKNKKRDVLLFEQARFALMGEMMANISHQWKQPLNTIGLSVVSLRTSNYCAQESDKYFEIVEDNVRYLASTIDDFMSFFDNKTHLELRTVDSLVKEIKSIVGAHLINSDIDLEIVIDSHYERIEIASSISQVVLNLINNAKDAFEKETHSKKIRVLFISTEFGLEIECCDNGKGIDDTIKEKIFDPYFTTKEKSQGTGIGLHMSKEIVQKVFNGHINISSRESSRSELYPESHVGKTCFYIAIPYSSKCVVKKEFS